MTFELFNEDNLAVLRRMPDNSVDAVVTDPPYGLGKEPDALAMLRDWMEHGHHDVKSKSGFMGKTWDNFVPQPAQWKEVYRVLKPGGHVLAFAGTRTQDLMALGLRIAGFEIRDLVAWIYGSGFPKSLNVQQAINKAARGCPQGTADPNSPNHGKFKGGCSEDNVEGRGFGAGAGAFMQEQGAARGDDEGEWQGWGTALKPALEPITLARKPLEGTVAENVLKWHTGALNIDGCRVDAAGADLSRVNNVSLGSASGGIYGKAGAFTSEGSSLGRWPANLIHDGSDEVLALLPHTASGTISAHHKRTTDGGNGKTLGHMKGVLGTSFGDSGSAARFFYCAKTNSTDRNEGCEALPDKDWSGDGAAVPERANRPFNPSKNNHPTVKPTALMRYLCRLVTPPGGTILDPWMGSGSTGKACGAEGFSFIGIDSDTEHGYFSIAEARVSAAFNKYQPEEWI